MSNGDLARIGRALAAVESCLLEAFPSDFYRRCAFASFAMRALLHDVGIDAVLVGGQFAALVVAPDEARSAVQGFKGGPELYPHIWLEAADRLIDLGPYLLAFGSDYPVVPMPAIAWDMSAPLPAAFRYRAKRRFPAGNRMSTDGKVNAQCAAFIEQCRTAAADKGKAPQLPTWVATSYPSLVAAVDRGDQWAIGAKRFEQIARDHPLPF